MALASAWQQMPLEARRLWQQTPVRRVVVNTGCRLWQVELAGEQLITAEQLQLMQRSLLAMVPGLQSLELVVADHQNPTTLAQVLAEYRQELLAPVIEDLPLAGGLMETAMMVAQGNKLVILLPNETSKQMLDQRGVPMLLRQVLQQRFNLQVELECLVDESIQVEDCSEQDWQELLQREVSQEKAKGKTQQQGNSQPAVLGKSIATKARPLKQVVEEERQVVVAGEVRNCICKELRSGRSLLTFELTDYTDSIAVKLYLNDAAVAEQLHDGLWVRVRGAVQTDNYLQELVLQPTDIQLAAAPVREDQAETRRVELHLHTKMSALDGMTDVERAVAQAAAWGHPALAITDHGVVQAFPDAYEAGQKHGLKIIYGLEGYLLNPDSDQTFHIVLLARNQEGLHNLYHLVSLSHLDNFYRRPRLPRAELERYRQGLLIGTACEAGELVRAYLAGERGEDLRRIAEFYDYLEIQPLANNKFLLDRGQLTSEEQLKEMNREIYRLGLQLHKPVVATGDVHFLHPHDAIYRQILLSGKGMDEDQQSPLYLRTTDEMLAQFQYLGAAEAYQVVVAEPQALAGLIDPLIKPVPDSFFPPHLPGAAEEVEGRARRTAAQWYGDSLPELVQQRLERELQAIIGNGYAVLYYISLRLVDQSHQDGYLVGSRGSVGSSLVATLTGITEVNPLPPHYRCPQCRYSQFIIDGSVGCGYDLPDKVCPQCATRMLKEGFDIPFEVFLGFEGEKVPDIDLNFSGEYQARAHKFAENLFGKEYVFRAGTIATIADRTAFGFVKKFLDERGIHARQAEINRLVAGCTGVKRTTGQHPGGLMVVPQDMDVHQFTPVQRPADDTASAVTTTHFDYNAISSRLVKLDILGHDDPTVIRMLEDMTGVDARSVPLDESRTMSLFSGVTELGVKEDEIVSPVGTFGIPEFGTSFVRQMLADTRPRTFSDLVRISGFSHGTDVWLKNAQELIKSGQCQLHEAIACRDDIMVYLIYRGLPPSRAFNIMEGVRKGKGVKPQDEELMQQHQIAPWYIVSCKKIKYMFPKAHAVAYVMMAYRIAYFKVYHPLAFYASFFTVRADEFEADLMVQGVEQLRKEITAFVAKGNAATARERNLQTIMELVAEMLCRGFTMHRVSLEASAASTFTIVNQGLLPPLAALQGVGKAAAENIVAARTERHFRSQEDLKVRGRATKTVLEALERHGCLAGLAVSDQITLF